MKLLWGDIHNHCGITYGVGALGHALDNARGHLDFCSVTPHAFWPDMPEKCNDMALVCEFHERGFEKIAANWPSYISKIDSANAPGLFTTFFSYEMHSGRWGDHTFLAYNRDITINREQSPCEVVESSPQELLAIPHHIGYSTGYRGICWDGFQNTISPVVEVCSKHGCAMSDKTKRPYYHDMGPLDSCNTVYKGLSRGHRFGFIGSTDHHAGYPGSYGDGKMAVLAKSNSRESIWEAIRSRRCYAVTADKIACSFKLNGCDYGSETERKSASISYGVTACSTIDRIVIYRDLRPFEIIDGLRLPFDGKKYKIFLELGWGLSEHPYFWQVKINVDNGKILDAEPCFRGRNFISPTQGHNFSNDVNISRNCVTILDEYNLSLTCETVRNFSTLHPSTAGVVIEIEGGNESLLSFEINDRKECKKIGALLECGFAGQMKPYSSHSYKIHTAVPHGKYCFSGEAFDAEPGFMYHMEVSQNNGSEAFVSPVFML